MLTRSVRVWGSCAYKEHMWQCGVMHVLTRSVRVWGSCAYKECECGVMHVLTRSVRVWGHACVYKECKSVGSCICLQGA